MQRATADELVVDMEHLDTHYGRILRSLPEFRKNERGTVAILFGLAAIPLLGLAGAALDYSRAVEFRGKMQRDADGVALSIATADTPVPDPAITALKTRIANYYGANSNLVSSVTSTNSWTNSGADYTLTVSANLKMNVVSLVPGAPSSLPISVTTVVRQKPAKYDWTLPTTKDLSNEAYDYNRISVYCYDDSKKNEANKGRRLETLTAIADNYGTDYSKAEMPTCVEGETLSYKLWNVRNGKEPGKTKNLKWWQKTSSGKDPETVMSARSPSETDYYSFYTDSTIDQNTRVITNKVSGGKENSSGNITTLSDVTNPPILETAICTTGTTTANTECKPKSEGGVLPNIAKNKTTPQVATGGCSEGKSIYYGWEDRPPSAGGSDKDYDDIRIVVTCPTRIKVADKEVRIVK